MRTNPVIEALGRTAAAEGRCIIAPNARVARLLNRHARSGNIARPLAGCFASMQYWQSLAPLDKYLHILRTLTIRHPHWTACSQSAAIIYGFTQSRRLLATVRMAVAGKRHQIISPRVQFHFPAAHHARMINGVRVTTPTATVLDCARDLHPGDALAIWDAAVRLRYLATSDSTRIITSARGHRGLRHASALAPFVDGRSENAGESMARLAMLNAGLPPPELQAEFRDRISGRTIRVDYLWKLANEGMVAAELDGRQKYADPTMLHSGDGIDAVLREKNRDSNLSLLKIHTVHFSYKDIHNGIMLRKLTYAGIPCGPVRPELSW